MILNGGLGASTKTGIVWELQTSFEATILSNYHICPKTHELINLETGEITGIFNVPKDKFYKYLKAKHDIDWKHYLTKRLLGDETIVNENTRCVYIFEKKSQQCAGSVDEKIQTCDFKKKQFEKILKKLGYKVFYIYLLNDWFKQEVYRDVLKYIRSVGCEYYFNQVNDSKTFQILNTVKVFPRNQQLQLSLFS